MVKVPRPATFTMICGGMMLSSRPNPQLTTTTLSRRLMVSFHGPSSLHAYHRLSERTHNSMLTGERPADPSTLLTTEADLRKQVEKLFNWWQDKKQVLSLTGAGISTESGIPDYRGHAGSYHTGHKPMVHDQFMQSAYQRQRYWGRGMVGWRFFDERKPAAGHYALATLERSGKLGVTLEDRPDFYADETDYFASSATTNTTTGPLLLPLSVITQNVDTLHRRAGTRHILELHGRTDHLTCMQCGHTRGRRSFHEELEAWNVEWLEAALAASNETSDMRADGDADVATKSYEDIRVPACLRCGDGFFKPDVVFFGDSVPAYRVKQFEAAVNACDGLLVVGSSLAVHSAFRHVRAAHKQGTPIAILNVGNTRAEIEGLDNVLKIEAPAGPTLDALVRLFSEEGVT